MNQGRAKGVRTITSPEGASFVVFELDEHGREITRLLVTLTANDIPELVSAYAVLKGKNE